MAGHFRSANKNERIDTLFLKNEGLYFTRYLLLYFCVTWNSKIALKQFPPGRTVCFNKAKHRVRIMIKPFSFGTNNYK